MHYILPDEAGGKVAGGTPQTGLALNHVQTLGTQ